MKMKRLIKSGRLLAAAGFLYSAVTLWAEPPDAKPGKSVPKVEESKRVSVEVARDRAKVMHDIYEATLDVMHHRYFHRERSVVQAREAAKVLILVATVYGARAQRL